MNLNYFTLDEFDSPDAPGSGAEHMDQQFLMRLDRARAVAKVPFVITSGYRTQAHHDALTAQGYPTSSTSAHLKGLAADIACTDSRKRMDIIEALMASGIRRIGIGKTFIHCDSDPTKRSRVIWTY